MPVQGLTAEQILIATAEQVASGAKSTDRANRLPGETASEANARITAGYKDLLAKPVLTPELQDAGAEVKFVRQGAGGVGEYVVVTPIGAKIPADDATQWTMGIIPSNAKYVTGSTLGTFSNGDGTVTNVGDVPVTTITKAGETSARAFEGQDAYYTQPVGNTGKTQAQLDAAKGEAEALKLNQDIAKLLGGTVDPATGKVTGVAGKTVTSITPNADGTTTISASDGTKTTVKTPASTSAVTTPTTTTPTTTPTPTPISGVTPSAALVSSGTIPAGVDAQTRALIEGLQKQVADLTKQTATTTATTTTAQYNDRVSVYSAMADRFNKYGLTGLANKIKELAMQGATEATITLQLQETPEYQQRFAANADRLKKGLSALTPAEYVNVEDSYRQVLRAYGLKQFDNDAYVKQFIANDMSPTELSNRVVTAVQRVQNADPAITKQLKDYYGVGATDMVGYVLDPEQQFQKIERQIAASEIGVAAARQGLQAGVSVAEQLAAQGVSQAEAQKGYATIADILPTAEKLSDIYGTTLEGYGQAEGEQEVFNQLASAQRKRQKLTAREVAAFSGSSGAAKTSLSTSRVGQF